MHQLKADDTAPPPPPPPAIETNPTIVTQGDLVLSESLKESLVEAVREGIVPFVQNSRSEVKRLVQEETGSIFGEVWKRVANPLRLLDAMEAQLVAVLSGQR